MTGKVMELKDVISPDMLATRLTERFIEWETLRQVKKNEWEEVRRYVYATDTTQTTNVRLPWKNRTTLPKLCQIRDNLYSNYTATLFPKRKWLNWEANDKDSNSQQKRDAIINYMAWCIDQPAFKHELDKIILDYIDFGNCFCTVEWQDQRIVNQEKITSGFVGPLPRRISPLDIVMNPTAENFVQSPKMIRSIVSLGELREMLQRMSNDENRAEYEALYEYLRKIRFHARTFQGDWIQKDHLYSMDGFTSFRAYLLQDYVEVLTFYGDWYDDNNDTFEKNQVITVVDRHKLIGHKPNPSYFGYPPIFHSPWRKKQDNLWGMGPLDNLIGMQYRLDHIENMKADTADVGSYPVQKIKGFVEDYVWQPGEKIFIGDEGDVELVQPQINFQNMDFDINRYIQTMEEMAGAPKEAMGFRSPGEKTAYEVQRMENAASRIYQNKINQFEEQVLEPLLNAMLEMARRQMVGPQQIKIFDDEFKIATFQTLTVEDITGIGRIKPIAARHFAEKAELIQNITNLTSSGLWQTISPHFSSIKLAKIVEEVFDLKDYEVVVPFVALSEQAEAQMQTQALQQQMHMQTNTATGMGADFDTDGMGGAKPNTSPDLMKRQPPAGATPGGMLATQ
jgi:Bacteriophage head to tail connecting protein